MAFRKQLSGVSAPALALALVGGFLPATAAAQDATGEDANAVTTEDENAIIVTGFRASLETAVNTKKQTDQIVESVSAEDIGKLPDASIAESIARLPGVTSQRTSGRSNTISIRGFGPDYSQTLLNGREQTSTGENRTVEYDQYPSEVVNRVDIYKAANATLIGQGLAGTVDIRTVRPLEYGRQVLAVGGRGAYTDLGKLNAGSKEFGYRVNGTYIDQFADDRIGVSISASYVDEPYQIQEFNAWGYADAGRTDGARVIDGQKSYVTSTQLQRLGITGTLQFKPTDTLTLTADGFYSHFEDDQIKRGVETPLGGGYGRGSFGVVVTPTTIDENGLITSGTLSNVEGVVRNDAFERTADLYSGGVNALYDGEDGWSAWADFGYSRTDRSELSLESYAGTGYGGRNGATDTLTFNTTETGTRFSNTLNYNDASLIKLTDPLGWGGSRVQAGYSNDRRIKDEIEQYRIGVAREVDGFLSKVEIGLNYTTRDKSLTPTEYFLVLANGGTEATIPSEYILGATSLDYIGLGDVLSYDPRELLAGGVYRLDQNTSSDVLKKGYQIAEDPMTAYLMASIDQDVGAARLTGNIGVQAINTIQKSTGNVYYSVAGSTTRASELRTEGADYWDVLPSVNLSLRLPSDFVIRAAAARQMQRPRLDQLKINFDYGYDTTAGFYSGSGGNPDLRPFRANAFDMTVEKYFGSKGYVAVQGFYKHIVSWVYTTTTLFDYSGLPADTSGVTPSLGLLTQPINLDDGYVWGIEAAGTVPFEVVVPALEGFGVTGGVSYTKSQIETPDQGTITVPGYSDWVANGTLFFEKWGFSARGSVRYRSGYLAEVSGYGADRQFRQALPETVFDAQIGYDFAGGALDGLSVFIQGQNLTDEPFRTKSGVDAPANQIIDYQTYGRRVYAGLTYKF